MDKVQGRRSGVIAVSIIGGLFFVFGFVTWLNGALIPFLTIACELDHLQAYFVTLVFYIAYTVMALPMSLVLRRTGYKNGLALGLLIMAIGALIFLPAAMLRTYGVFLAGLFVLGTGLTILQTAANPYIVLIGPANTAAVRISIMGLLNKAPGSSPRWCSRRWFSRTFRNSRRPTWKRWVRQKGSCNSTNCHAA